MKDKQHLTDCEQQVMKCVWDTKEDMSLLTIVAMVNENYGKDWKPQTVSTFLSRLVKKGFLDMYRQGRLFFYHPLIQEKDYSAKVIEECVDFWSESNAGNLLCALNDRRKLRKDEVERIKELLDGLDK